MQTARWGPHAWRFLHTVATNYDSENPEHDAVAYAQFFRLLGDTLPCRYCRESWREFAAATPIEPYLCQPQGLAYWLYLMHNRVNDKLRKQGLLHTPDPSFEEVCAFYHGWRADCQRRAGQPATCRAPRPQRCAGKTAPRNSPKRRASRARPRR